MKKIITLSAMALLFCFGQQAQAQFSLKDILSGVANNAVSSATGSGSGDNGSNVGGMLGNLLASVTGGLTTTQATLQGDWSYTEPCVQFEGENFLATAGGTAAAAKVEQKLVTLYKVVGISAGRVKFSFAGDGTLTYTLGSRKFQGSYVFNDADKTVTITTATKRTVTAYVTVSGNQMSLCFDSTKVLQLFTTISANLSSSISTLAGSYKGMKTGFKFTRE